MAGDEAPNRLEPDRAATRPAPARLFAVRVWKEELGGASEYRGSVRDVSTDGFRGFCHWSDLVAFMVARLEESDRDRLERGGV